MTKHELNEVSQERKYISSRLYSLLRKNGLIFIQEMHSHSLIKTSIILNKFFLINYTYLIRIIQLKIRKEKDFYNGLIFLSIK